MIKKSFIFLFFFLFFSQKVFATPKESILENLNKINNLSFEFKQQIGEKIETGKCKIEYPKRMYCLYDGKNIKEVISNGKTLAIKNNRYNKVYFYRLKKTPFYHVLDKEYIISEIEKLKPQIINNQLIKFSVIKEKNLFAFFFNAKTFDLAGWETSDIYQNLVVFEINNIQKNIMIDKKLFKLPALD